MKKGDNEELLSKLNRRFSHMKSRRVSWEESWEDIAKYVVPRRSIFDDENEAKDISKGIFDQTAIFAAQMLADGLQGYLVSPSIPWFKLTPEDRSVGNSVVLRRYLETIEEVLYASFQRSNFYQTVNENFVDAVSIGTTTMYAEEDLYEDRIRFTARHPKEVFVEQDRYGKITTLFRRFKIKRRDLLDYFPEAQLPEELRKEMEVSGVFDDSETEYNIIHAVFPRKDRVLGKLDGKGKKFASIYFIEERDDVILRESGYDLFPYAVWRWRTNTDEEYGRSPAMDCLADVKALNQMNRSMLKRSQLEAEPMFNAPASARGHGGIKIQPNGINWMVKPTDKLEAVGLGMQYSIGKDQMESKKQRIQETFRADVFLMLSQSDNQMTAREVVERQGEKAAVLGSIIGRMASEFLDPIIDIVFNIENKAGRIPPPPQGIQLPTIKVDYIGPLAQAQRKYHATQGIDQALAQIIPLAQINPNILDHLDFDAIAQRIASATGMSADLMREEAQVQAMRQQKAMQQQQAQAQQQAMLQADLYSKTGKAPESGSPAEMLAEQQRQMIERNT